jgi:putative membrane protein
MGDLYSWLKALHVISIIAWMAGLLYLPRLYVYHCQAPVGSAQSEMLKTMERRLLRAIMNPAMIVAWILGLWLAYESLAYTQPWFHAKALLVVLMTGSHMAMAKWRKAFEADKNTNSEKFYRVANEIPTVLMIVIVILVIVKPF